MLRYLCIFLFLLSEYLPVKGEGTKELSPVSDVSKLVMSTEYSNFGLYGANDYEKIKIKISSVSEKIYYGFNNNRDQSIEFVSGVIYRIVAPSGKIVLSGMMPDVGNPGNIATWSQAINGPQQLGNAMGYDALIVIPDETGDYVIEFDPSVKGSPSYIGGNSRERLNLRYFDVTVAGNSNSVLPGRLHSQAWQISTESYSGEFRGKVYPYDGGSAVYEVDLNGNQPYLFIINFNSKGAVNSSITDPIIARQSKIGNFNSPEYEVFLNPPDELLYPVTQKEVKIKGSATKISCSKTEFCFTSNSKGFLEGFLDFNNNNEYDPNQGEVYFGKLLDGTNPGCISWDGKDNNGTTVQNAKFKVLSKVGFGVTHLPLYDVEQNRNGYKVKVVRPAGTQPPLLFWDDSNIKAGNTMGDALVNLTGCLSTETNGCHKWENRGDYSEGKAGYFPQETINTWWYSSILLDTLIYSNEAQGSVQLSYNPGNIDKRDTTVCKGDSLKFFIYNDGSFHFNNGRYKYEWKINDSKLQEGFASQAIKIESNSQIVVNATDRQGLFCPTADTMHVSVTEKVRLSSVVSSDCQENSGRISTTIVSGSNPQFYWKEFPQEKSGELKNLKPGTYHVTVKNPLLPQCRADTSYSISASAKIGIDTVVVSNYRCLGVAGKAEVRMKDKTLSYEYSWDNKPYSSSPVATDLVPGTHVVEARIQSSTCSATKPFIVQAAKSSIQPIVVNESCGNKNGSIEFKVGAESQATILWDGVSNQKSIKEGLSEGTYHITFINNKEKACNTDTVIKVGSNSKAVTAAFVTDKNLITDTLFTETVIHFQNLSKNIKTSLWDFGDGNKGNTYDVSHMFAKAGNYLVSLTVQDENGCSNVSSIVISVFSHPPCGIALPNAFSPNNDAGNDRLGILGKANKIDLKIFNRWGEVIYRTNNIIDRWDGSYRGEEVPIGVYPFILEYYCPGDQDKLVKSTEVGEITLVR